MFGGIARTSNLAAPIRTGVRGPSRSLALALLLALLTLAPAFAAGQLDLTLLHTNDVHGHLLPFDYGERVDVGGAARRASLVDQIRRDTPNPVLLVDAGDTITAGPLWTEYLGKLDIEVMNLLGYEMAAVGNNEFKVTADTSAQAILLDLVRRSRFPWLCANAFDGSGALLTGVKPYLVREIAGVRVAFLGLTAPRAADYPQTAGWKIADPIAVARELVPRIRKEADLLIAITHLGYPLDLQLAGEVPDIDAIVGGDSHTFLPGITLVQRPRDARQTSDTRRPPIPVVHSGEFAMELGRLDLRFEEQEGRWSLRGSEWTALPITAAVSERADIAWLVGTQAAALRRPLARVEVPGRNAVERERSTRRLIARAVRAETGADVALQPAGSLYGEWKSGPISLYDIRYVMPFPNRVAVATVQGSALATLLMMPDMAMDGAEIRASYDGSNPQIWIGNAVVDAAKEYRVAVEDYRTTYMPGLVGSPVQTGGDIRDVVARWLQRIGIAALERPRGLGLPLSYATFPAWLFRPASRALLTANQG
jgi:2',3'-cyclic-nucleotide 2'-phosphodiesterase (5'-nucleotidase family)